MKKMAGVIFILGIWSCVLGKNVFADENSVPVPNPVETSIASEKLDKVIQTQEQILKELDEIKAELEIVKIRASQT